MAISMETLALAIAWAKKHGGGGGGVDPDDLGDLAYLDTVTLTPDKETVTPMKSVGTLPELTTTVVGKNVTIGFNKGTLPEKDTEVEVMTNATITVE